MKKAPKLLLILMLACLLLLGLSAMALAVAPPQPTEEYDAEFFIWQKEMRGCPYTEPEAVNVQVNGEWLSFDDARPVIMQGRTMTPYRALFEAMGAEVNWDVDTRTAAAIFPDGLAISVALGDLDMAVTNDGVTQNITMDAAPYLDDKLGRVYVPARFIAEAAGWEVAWDDFLRIVSLENAPGIIAAIDSRFTNFNRVMALGYAFDPEKSYDYSLAGSMKVTLYGETQGSSATLSGEASGAIGGQGLRCDISIDTELGFVEDFLDVASGLYGGPSGGYSYGYEYSPEYMDYLQYNREQELKSIKQALSNSELSLIMDDMSGDIFLRTTLTELLFGADSGVSEKTWVRQEQAFAPGDVAELLSMMNRDFTLGQLLVDLRGSTEAILIADFLYAFYGDGYFTASTSGAVTTYRVNQTQAGLIAYMQELAAAEDDFNDRSTMMRILGVLDNLNSLNFTMQLRESDGALLDSSIDCRLDAPGFVPYTLSVKGSGSAEQSQVSYALTGKYIGKIEADLSSTLKERGTPYQPQLPEGAQVIPMP